MSTNPIVMLHSDKPELSLKIVQEKHPDLTILTCDTYADLSDQLVEHKVEVLYSVRFAGTPNFPRTGMLEAPHIQWISVGGSGTDHLLPWQSDRVTVTNAAGVAADMMAEYVLGSLLSFRLQLRRFHDAQKAQQWLSTGTVTPIEGSTALIIGLGHTGRSVAKRLNAMGIKVLGTRARPQATEFVDEVHATDSLHDLLPRADCVICTVPLLDSTRNILSTQEFNLLRSNCVLIDVSRGGVVDQTALLAALNNGKLNGAALDVFEQEPLPTNHSFWQMDNVLITPHCSSVYDGWDLKSVAMFADNLQNYRRGEPLTNIVNPERGY